MGDHYRRLRRLKRAAVRWSRVAYAAGGANYHTLLRSGCAGALEIANVIQGALQVF